MRPDTLGAEETHLLNSTWAIGEWSPWRSGKGELVLYRKYVKSGGKADITKFLSLLYPFQYSPHLAAMLAQ